MRSSSVLPYLYYHKVIARYYRSYIYLVIEVLRSFKSCKEINIVGDCVSSIFVNNGKDKHYRHKYSGDIPSVIEALRATSMLYPLLNVLNFKFYSKYGKRMGIHFGVGIAMGHSLVMKAGEFSGNIHKYIFLGNNVNLAAHLCDKANKKGKDNHFVLVDKSIKNHCKRCLNNINGLDDTFYNHLSYCGNFSYPQPLKNDIMHKVKKPIYGGNFYKDTLKYNVKVAKYRYKRFVHKHQYNVKHN